LLRKSGEKSGPMRGMKPRDQRYSMPRMTIYINPVLNLKSACKVKSPVSPGYTVHTHDISETHTVIRLHGRTATHVIVSSRFHTSLSSGKGICIQPLAAVCRISGSLAVAIIATIAGTIIQNRIDSLIENESGPVTGHTTAIHRSVSLARIYHPNRNHA